MDRIKELEQRVSRIEAILRESVLANDSRNQMTFLCIDYGISVEQWDGIAQAMEQAYKAIFAGQEPTAFEFERMLSPYLPPEASRDVHHFIQALLGKCLRSGQWDEVAKCFRSEFNVNIEDASHA